jgi:sugar phosphate isomerase/epimerase
MFQYKTTALIGYTGFVGFNLTMKYNFTHQYNSKNIHEITNKSFDIVVCAGISANKWWANLHEEEDMKNIMELLNILATVKTKKFVLISTIDVYDNINNDYVNEDTIIDSTKNHVYGRNRYFAETFIRDTFEDHLIIRLPGLFGYGLKKNIIFDFINNKLMLLNLNSSFQWYNISNIGNDLNKYLETGDKLINLFTEPITNQDLHNIFSKYKKTKTYTFTYNNLVHYNVKTKYNNSGYIDTKSNILMQLEKYIDNMLNGKLTISNLAWSHGDDKKMLDSFEIFGLKTLEVSPYKYFSFNDNVNIDIYAFQSILYPHTFNIFREPDVVFEYLKGVIETAGKNKVKVLVFGSPKNRKRDDIDYNMAMYLAIIFFKKISKICEQNNVIMTIEPNAKCYGCDFITNSVEGRKLVLNVDSPFFKLHLDIGCMFLENENILECITNNLDILEHIHFSAPNLECLLNNDKINYNKLFYGIKQIYNKIISIEMLKQDDINIYRDIINVLG